MYRNYPYNPEDGRNDAEAGGAPVLRGGSWINFQRYARCASRYWHAPDSFYNYIGFRVVVSLANSGF
ncbi:MAG: SUMF1/EgtB/PvdO family nonheme iron enzyme [Betaproteobacteria bacterium]|nr:SUMF1/EgtB/PvdO family nonheme iron enzyme [Betaproteobacteria bacterium]MBI3053500.1 SUMF1/EgtB/PvdO family nonheme iron enzyme [Betaproteobacteria bacterium]